ncbi:MAG: amidohydrolase family protein [Desulfurococcales archaeon]|nr:amidohydrolase family protein [Desulfurococcales archaeon]
MRVIDFHTHLPFRYKDPVEAASYLVSVMDRSGVERAVVIAIEGGVRSFRRRMNPRYIREAAEEILDYVAYNPSAALRKILFEPEESIKEHETLLVEHRRRTEEVVMAAERFPDRLLPVGSFNPDLGVEETLKRLRRYQDVLIGVKIYPTLHCIHPASRNLQPLYNWAAKNRKIVIIHTGCDPGMWELPKLCRYARPKYVAEAARKNPDVVYVIAHMGAYSMLMPGIFFREALNAAQLENIYLDTSATEPIFIERAVEEIGYEKILYGSDYPYVVGVDMRDTIEEILSLDIPGEAKRAILRENAERLLKNLGVL